MKTSLAFRTGLVNHLARPSGALYVVQFFSGTMPATLGELDLHFQQVQSNPAYGGKNWNTLAGSTHVCSMQASTVSSGGTFTLGSFVPPTQTMHLESISLNHASQKAGVITWAALFPVEKVLANINGRISSYNWNIADGGGSAANIYGNGIRDGMRGGVICLESPASLELTHSATGLLGKPCCIAVSVGLTGSDHPLTVDNTTVAANQTPTVTRCSISFK